MTYKVTEEEDDDFDKKVAAAANTPATKLSPAAAWPFPKNTVANGGVVDGKLRVPRRVPRPVLDRLPEWKYIAAKEAGGEPLNRLERFIFENEPADDAMLSDGSPGASDVWRRQLVEALEEVWMDCMGDTHGG